MSKHLIRLTEEQYIQAREDYSGFCLACGAEMGSCEPDARNYKCESCERNQVFGVEELLIMGRIEILPERDRDVNRKEGDK